MRLPVLVAAASLLTAQAPSPLASPGWPAPLPTTAPLSTQTVIWNGAPAATFSLDVAPLGVTPDGDAQTLVRVVLHDANGAITRIRRGADFDYIPSRGTAQWQTRLRYGGPAAIVSVRDLGPFTVRVVANRPHLREQRIAIDPSLWRLPRVVAGAVGPHLARIGWFPRLRPHERLRIDRITASGSSAPAATVSNGASSWDDASVRPGSVARYVVVRGTTRVAVRAALPPELPASTLDALRGKSAWLAFSGDPQDDEAYTKLDVDGIVQTAQRAGIRSIELRLAYGAFNEVTPAAKVTIDGLIDACAAKHIAIVGWTVPRANAYDDLARNSAVAAYRTPAGNGITGLAVDLERGEEFLGDGKTGYRALHDYLGVVRRAVGARVLLVATVEDPFLEHLDQRAYPYAAIARDADVLQPMTYWRMIGPWDSPDKARDAVTGSVALLRRLAARDVAIDVGAQTGILGKRGAPPGDEVAAAIDASRRAGAIGVTIYDWTGTGPEQWDAVARTAW